MESKDKEHTEQKAAAGSAGRQKILEGVNLVVYTVVGIAIVVLANWFVDRHDTRWDLTPAKRYSLSPQTLKILKGLDRDVSIYIFDQKQRLREGRDLLENYEKASGRVSLRYSDLDREPSLAKQFGVRNYGAVVVASGENHYEAKNSDEEGVTNAIVRLLTGQKTVYFVSGHGERNLENTERSGYSKVKQEFENENYQVKALTLLQKMEIPSDCSLLVIAGPQNDDLPPEVDAIRKYLAGGGRAMFMLDPGVDLPNLSKLLEDWNVTPRNDLVIDLNPVAQVFGTEPTMPLIVKYGSNPIVQPLTGYASLFPVTRSFSVGKDYKAGASVDSLCETSADSYGSADFNPKVHTVSAFRQGTDTKGPLTVAVAATISGEGEKKTEGRFVALGTSALPANVFLGFQANRDLFMNMVNWLEAEENMISIRPKPPEEQHLNVTQRQMNNILYFGVIGLPLAIIAVGTSVWWRRR